MPKWLKYDERIIPKFPEEVENDIKDIMKMGIASEKVYDAKNGKKLFISSVRFPAGAVIKGITEHEGGIRTVGEGINEKVIDTRMYHTPGATNKKGKCVIAYWTEAPDPESDQGATIKTFKDCSVEHFKKLVGWNRKGGLKLPFEWRADTTPTTLDPIAMAEVSHAKKQASAGASAPVVPFAPESEPGERIVEEISSEDIVPNAG